MFRAEYEPDLRELSRRATIRATCVLRGRVEPDRVQFEDCRLPP